MGPSATAVLISSPKASIPGFGSPMALAQPPTVSVKFGFGCPGFGTDPTDFDTTAPAPERSILTIDAPVSSMIPDATMPGLSRHTLPMLTRKLPMSGGCPLAFINDAHAQP